MLRVQRFESVHLRVADVLEHMAQPFEGVYLLFPAHGEERIDRRRPLRRIVRAGKQIILPAQRQRPNRILDQVVVDLQAAVIQRGAQLIPTVQALMHRFADWTLRQHVSGFQFAGHPLHKRIERRQRVVEPARLAAFR